MKSLIAILLVLFSISKPAVSESIIGSVVGADHHPYKGTWYFADTWKGNCNSTKVIPDSLREWIANKRLSDVANSIREPRVYAACSAGIVGLGESSKNGDYISGQTNSFHCTIYLIGGRRLERYRLYADKKVCSEEVRNLPPGG